MSIELDHGRIREAVADILRRQGHERYESLSNMVTETMYEVAVMTKAHGPEQGIIRGLAMIKTWQDE